MFKWSRGFVFNLNLTIETSNSTLPSISYLLKYYYFKFKLTERKPKCRGDETRPKSRESAWHRIHWRHLATKNPSVGIVSTDLTHNKTSLQRYHHTVNEYADNKIREKCTCRTACRYGLDAISLNVNFIVMKLSTIDARSLHSRISRYRWYHQ